MAFLWSFTAVWQSAPACYFWTLTPEGYMSDRLFALAVNRFLRRWERWGRPDEFKAVRVYEPFKSGFLHCHFICNDRFSVQAMRRIAHGTGIGRLHVRRASTTDAGYLLKYLGKCRGRLGEGLRTWAKWGAGWTHTRVRDVVVESPDADLMRQCYERSKHCVGESYNDETKTVTYYVKSLPQRQVWVNARALFVREKTAQIKAWTHDELTPF